MTIEGKTNSSKISPTYKLPILPNFKILILVIVIIKEVNKYLKANLDQIN